jgi:hypothetical protein
VAKFDSTFALSSGSALVCFLLECWIVEKLWAVWNLQAIGRYLHAKSSPILEVRHSSARFVASVNILTNH